MNMRTRFGRSVFGFVSVSALVLAFMLDSSCVVQGTFVFRETPCHQSMIRNGKVAPIGRRISSPLGLADTDETLVKANTDNNNNKNNNKNSNNNNNDNNRNKPTRVQGVYSRPSAAIERGSGFFVPGLEGGGRIRALFGVAVLVLTAVNDQTTTHAIHGDVDVDGGLGVSRAVAVTYGLLLVLQALVEFTNESGVFLRTTTTTTKEGAGAATTAKDDESGSVDVDVDVGVRAGDSFRTVVDQRVSPDVPRSCRDDLTRIGGSLLALTPATHVLLLEAIDTDRDTEGTGTVLYSLGSLSDMDTNHSTLTSTAAWAAVRTAASSRGGRVSIPADHPASVLVPEAYRRCLVLQRMEDTDTDTNTPTNDSDSDSNDPLNSPSRRRPRRCLLVASDQLLPAFTNNDLKWLGQLADYAQLSLRLR